MKWLTLGFFAAVAGLLGSAAAEEVITLGGANFTEAVKANEKLVVEFYAPWCGHCKKLTPEYEKAAAALKSEGIVLAKVDATEEGNKKLAEQFGIKGFPTLKIFRGDAAAASEYEGPREADGIVSYLKSQFGPAATEVADGTALKAVKEPAEAAVHVLAVLPEGETSSSYKEYLAAADTLRGDAEFKYTFDANLEPAAKGKDALFVFKAFDEPITRFEGTFTKADLVDFVTKASTPRLVSLDRSKVNAKRLQAMFGDQEIPKFIGAMPLDSEGVAAFKEELIKVIYLDPKENEGAMTFFGAKKEDTPCVMVHSGKDNTKYSSGKIELSKIQAWAEDFLAGKIEKTIKSEDPPETNDGPVKIVTANTFDDIVFSGNDVLIEFYAPWCGHCKKLAPIYDELGQFYKDKNASGLTIAKMDATTNDVPSEKFNVKGFPTIMFVSGKDGKVMSYDGGRELKDFQKYLADNSAAAKVVAEESPAGESKDEL